MVHAGRHRFLLADRITAIGAAELLTAEIDRSYEAYKALPLDTEDEWGNLADFLDATRTT